MWDNRYVRQRSIGTGAFGQVWLCTDSSNNNEQVAIKMIPVALVNENTLRELRNHQQLSIHPHVIQFKGAFVSEQHLCIVMEYARGGSLLTQIQQFKEHSDMNLSEDLCRWCFQQHILAMYFCHRMQVVNRDIKPDNMLVMWPVSFESFNIHNCLNGDLSNAPVLKIADFGYSKNLNQDSKPASVVGTLTHIAPEVLKNLDQQTNRNPYDAIKADIWSSGVALFELLTGTTPFQRARDKGDKNMLQLIINRILSQEYNFPAHCNVSQDAKDLVRKILVTEPDQRITTLQIFQHPWFRQNFPIPNPVEWTNQYVNHVPYSDNALSQEQLNQLMKQVEQQKKDKNDQDKEELDQESDEVSDEEALRIRREQRNANQMEVEEQQQNTSIPMYTVKQIEDSHGHTVQQWVPTGECASRDVLRQKILEHLQQSGALPNSSVIDQEIQQEIQLGVQPIDQDMLEEEKNDGKQVQSLQERGNANMN